jgi:superfamily I DNA/RNA helicase
MPAGGEPARLYRVPALTLPRPRGRQGEVVYLHAAGHLVVLGTAGTGKTVMAMLRAHHLASPSTPGYGPVLLVTYNNTLVTYLRYLQDRGATDITVETYGRFARGYLNSRGQMPRWGGIATPSQRRALVHQAVKEVAANYQPSRFFDRDTGFFLDELEWISGMGLGTLEEYLESDRVGRKTGLDDARRTAVWRILQTYRRLRDELGVRYDWYDIATAVREQLAVDQSPRRYRHVVIDEGQDLSPEVIRSLVEAADPGGSVTLFGDYAQQIYGQGISWRACNLDLRGRPVERFADNYRNSREVARLAIAMSRMPLFAGDPDDLVEPVEPTAAGVPPTLVNCRDEAEEIAVAQSRARALGRVGTVAILARTWADARRASRGLNARRLHPDMRVWDAAPGIYCGAYHSAKGLEFDAVILPFASATRMPNRDVIDAFGESEAAARESKLLYVAVTRAKTDLIITYSGTLTPLLPPDPALYQQVTP